MKILNEKSKTFYLILEHFIFCSFNIKKKYNRYFALIVFPLVFKFFVFRLGSKAFLLDVSIILK